MLVPGAIRLIQIIVNKSKTNKDNKTVCMVGCLYSVGARGNTIDSNNSKQKLNKQGQQDSVHGGVSLQCSLALDFYIL